MGEAYMQHLRDQLIRLYRAGVEAAAPGPALARVLGREVRVAPAGRVWIVAFGKAASPMASAAVSHLDGMGCRAAGGLVIAPETAAVDGLESYAGDHPVPGERSLAASEALGRLTVQTAAGDEVWVLLSGGATSLVAAPAAGLAATDLQALYRVLFSSGLDISAMNTVRKRFSRWGAGRLAVALAPARVRTFVLSDVIGDDLAAIGSGPCVADASSASDVLALLQAPELGGRIPPALMDHLRRVEREPGLETPKPGHPALAGVESHLVAGNRLSLEAVARRAGESGWRPHLITEPLQGEASGAGRRLAAILLSQPPGTCLIAGGETVVRIDPDNQGRGGRSQELALAAAKELAGSSPAALLAAGTDGRDGPTDAAGAVVDANTWPLIGAAGRNPEADLAQHDSYSALRAAGALLVTGPTGTNVMDLVIGLMGKTA
jgi:glycerate-2-kinase